MKVQKIIKRITALAIAFLLTVTIVPVNTMALDLNDQPLGENVALGKKAYVVGRNTDASAIVDGNTSKGFQPDAASPDPEDSMYDPQQWIVDLEDSFTIDRINLYWENACAKVFDIYVSVDGDEWNRIVTEENGNPGQHTYVFDRTDARYIKLDMQYRSMTWGYNLYEIEAFTVGTVDKEGESTNITPDATAEASCYEDVNSPDRAIDGNMGTRWQAPENDPDTGKPRSDKDKNNDYITLKWDEAVNFNAVKIAWDYGHAREYDIQVSDDGEEFTTVASVKDGGANDRRFIRFAPQHAQYLRVQCVKVGAYRCEIFEIEVLDESQIAVEDIVTNQSVLYLNETDKKTKQINVKVSPKNAGDQTINWTSSDEGVAKVDENGLVSAVAQGEAVITGTSNSTPDVYKTFRVYVSRNIPKTQVVATKIPGTMYASVEWSQVDKATGYQLYRVAGEKETLIFEGIETSFTDTDLGADGASYYVVAVADKDDKLVSDSKSDKTEHISPTEVSLDTTEVDVEVGDTARITADVTPAEVEDRTVSWTSENPGVAIVNKDGVVRGVSEGQTVVIATSNYGKAVAMCIVNVTAGDIVQPLGENIALNKPVHVPENSYDARKIVDGDMDSSFQAKAMSPDESNPKYDPQDWIIDLESIYVFDTIKIAWENACASDYDIYVSNTNDEDSEWVLVASEKKGSAGKKIFDLAPVKARYVKLQLKHRALEYGYRIFEVEIITTGSVPDVEVENIATKAHATASAFANENTKPSKAIDGDEGSEWQAPNVGRTEAEMASENITLEWDSKQQFDTFKLVWDNGFPSEYILQTSDNGEDWTDIYTVTNGRPGESAKIHLAQPVESKYLRVQGVTIGAYRYELKEIYVYNESTIPVSDMKFNRKEMRLNLDNPAQASDSIQAKINPGNAGDPTLIWTSDDTGVCIVNQDGVVAGVDAGVTVVRAVSRNNPDVSRTCKVYVTKSIDQTVVSAQRVDKTDQIKVDWNTVEHAVGYELYRVVGNNETMVYSGTDTSFVDKELAPGYYDYYVKAIADKTSGVLNDSVSEKVTKVAVPIDVTGVAIVPNDIEIFVGDSEYVTVSIEPADAWNKDYTWSIEGDEGVITINDVGKITAHKEGSATLKATTADGEYVATCKVKAIPVEAKGIAFEKTEETIKIGDSCTLFAEIFPSNTTYKDLTWSSSDETVATVENGVVTGISAGTATITATCTYTPTVTAEFTITVEKEPEPTTVAQTTNKPTAQKTVVTPPGKVYITKAPKKKLSAKKLKIKFKKVKKAAGYLVKISTKSNCKKALVKKYVKKTTATIKSAKLKNKKKLFVKVRAYKLDAGTKVFGKWSKAKKVKIKK